MWNARIRTQLVAGNIELSITNSFQVDGDPKIVGFSGITAKFKYVLECGIYPAILLSIRQLSELCYHY